MCRKHTTGLCDWWTICESIGCVSEHAQEPQVIQGGNVKHAAGLFDRRFLTNRRGQIKMFETIGVLIVFFFLLVIGATFYFKMQESALSKELLKQSQLRSLQTVQRAVFLPELDCSFVSVTRENCFDDIKLHAFAQMMETPEMRKQYYDQFGLTNITVYKIHPGNDRVSLYQNPPAEYRRITKSHIPVLWYDPINRDFSFGVMEVMSYAEH